MIEVLHTEAAHIFNKGLDLFISLHRFIAFVVNIHHIRHKTARRKTEQQSHRGKILQLLSLWNSVTCVTRPWFFVLSPPSNTQLFISAVYKTLKKRDLTPWWPPTPGSRHLCRSRWAGPPSCPHREPWWHPGSTETWRSESSRPSGPTGHDHLHLLRLPWWGWRRYSIITCHLLFLQQIMLLFSWKKFNAFFGNIISS